MPGLRLTERELEVLRLVAQGMNNREIAKQLFISENTVKNHVRNILEKLQLHSRMEAVMYAVKEKLLDLPCPTRDRHRRRVERTLPRMESLSRAGAAGRAGRAGLPATRATPCRRCAPSSARWSAPACSRSTRSTCCSAPTTCRCTPGWGRTTSTLLTAPRPERAAAADGGVLGARPGVHAGRPVAGDAAPDGRATAPRRGKWGCVAEAPDLEADLLAEVRDRGAVDRPRPRRRPAPQPRSTGAGTGRTTRRRARLPLHRRRAGDRGPQPASSSCSTTCPSG